MKETPLHRDEYKKNIFNKRFFFNHLLDELLSLFPFLFIVFTGILFKKINFFELIKQIPNLLLSLEGKFFGALLILAIGCILFLFKKIQQFWYGVFETMFSISTCFSSFELIRSTIIKESVQFTSILTIISTIYLVVRGISNIDDGYKKEFWWKKYFIIPNYTLALNIFSDNKFRIIIAICYYIVIITIISSMEGMEGFFIGALFMLIIGIISISLLNMYVSYKNYKNEYEAFKR